MKGTNLREWRFSSTNLIPYAYQKRFGFEYTEIVGATSKASYVLIKGLKTCVSVFLSNNITSL